MISNTNLLNNTALSPCSSTWLASGALTVDNTFYTPCGSATPYADTTVCTDPNTLLCRVVTSSEFITTSGYVSSTEAETSTEFQTTTKFTPVLSSTEAETSTIAASTLQQTTSLYTTTEVETTTNDETTTIFALSTSEYDTSTEVETSTVAQTSVQATSMELQTLTVGQSTTDAVTTSEYQSSTECQTSTIAQTTVQASSSELQDFFPAQKPISRTRDPMTKNLALNRPRRNVTILADLSKRMKKSKREMKNMKKYEENKDTNTGISTEEEVERPNPNEKYQRSLDPRDEKNRKKKLKTKKMRQTLIRFEKLQHSRKIDEKKVKKIEDLIIDNHMMLDEKDTQRQEEWRDDMDIEEEENTRERRQTRLDQFIKVVEEEKMKIERLAKMGIRGTTRETVIWTINAASILSSNIELIVEMLDKKGIDIAFITETGCTREMLLTQKITEKASKYNYKIFVQG